ncbi:unnamed protein product, partial [Amoebophrya sp. A25]
ILCGEQRLREQRAAEAELPRESSHRRCLESLPWGGSVAPRVEGNCDEVVANKHGEGSPLLDRKTSALSVSMP